MSRDDEQQRAGAFAVPGGFLAQAWYRAQTYVKATLLPVHPDRSIATFDVFHPPPPAPVSPSSPYSPASSAPAMRMIVSDVGAPQVTVTSADADADADANASAIKTSTPKNSDDDNTCDDLVSQLQKIQARYHAGYPMERHRLRFLVTDPAKLPYIDRCSKPLQQAGFVTRPWQNTIYSPIGVIAESHVHPSQHPKPNPYPFAFDHTIALHYDAEPQYRCICTGEGAPFAHRFDCPFPARVASYEKADRK